MKRRGEGFNLKYSVWHEGVTRKCVTLHLLIITHMTFSTLPWL